MHTLLQANGTPGLQMLESNVMVRGPRWWWRLGLRQVAGPTQLFHELTLFVDLPLRGKEDNEKSVLQGSSISKMSSLMKTKLKCVPLIDGPGHRTHARGDL